MDGGDSLSQGGYDSSDREAILDDVIHGTEEFRLFLELED